MQVVQKSSAAQVGRPPLPLRSSALHFAGYLALLGVLALLCARWTPGLHWGMSAAEIAAATARSGAHDPGSFITGAQDIARYGWVTPQNYWLVHLWPPGFMLLQGALLRVLGEGTPILVPLLLLALLCSAAWMVLLREVLRPRMPLPAATLAPLVPFAFPVAPFVLFTPLALSLGETFSISFFLGAFLLVLLARRTASWWQAVSAGLLLALSAYFRSQFEVLVAVLTLGAGVVLAASVLAFLRKRKGLVDRNTLRAVLVSVAVAHLAMLPWRIHNYLEAGTAGWVQTSTVIAINSLTPEAELLRLGGHFVVEGGGHLACKLEPSFCGQKDQEFFYRAFFMHPVEWIVEKARRLPPYWLAPSLPSSLSSVDVAPAWYDILANLVLLGCIVASLWRLWRIRREAEFAVQAWFQLSFYVALAGVYTLAHFEGRYFYLPKIFSVVALLTLLPSRADPSKNEVNR